MTMAEALLNLAPSLKYMGETTKAGHSTMEPKPQLIMNSTSAVAAIEERVEGK
jgi:hypothetical protein